MREVFTISTAIPKLPFVTYVIKASCGLAVSQTWIFPSQVVAASRSPVDDSATAHVPSVPVHNSGQPYSRMEDPPARSYPSGP